MNMCCPLFIFNLGDILSSIRGLSYDHEFISPFCGPELADITNMNSIIKGYSSIMRRCFYKYDSHDITLGYSKKFW